MNIYSKLIILGSGPAGLTSAIYSSRLNLNPLLISGKEEGGQLSLTKEIENWPGLIEKISGYDLYKKMYNQAIKFNTKIIFDYIKNVDFSKDKFKLFGEDNIYECKSLIIATGSSAKKIGILNEEKYLGKGISTCAICDGPLYKKKDIAIIGGGNTALEEAIYLSEICSKVYLIHRKNIFKADDITINKLENKKNNNIYIYKNNVLNEIKGNNNELKSILILNLINNKISKLDISALFIAIGYEPNTKLFINKLELTESNHIKIKMKNKKNFTSTSIPGIFAAGDVVDSVYRQAITASSFGCMAAIDAKNYLINKNYIK